MKLARRAWWRPQHKVAKKLVTIGGVESAECPVSIATPQVSELLKMEALYLVGKSAGAPPFGSDVLHWPAWWADLVAVFEGCRTHLEAELTKATHGG